MNRNLLWFSDYNKKYSGNEPAFYNVAELPIAQLLEKNYAAICEELKPLWLEKDDTLFGAYDTFDDKQFPPRSWRKLVLKVWGLNNKPALRRFPVTASLLNQSSNILSCFITKTAPNSLIKPHCGETNAHLRIHLGLKVPDSAGDLCAMEVINTTVKWQNGKTFAFLDAHEHHVWNRTNSERYVLIVDVIRPEFKHKRSFICTRVIVSQLFFYTLSLAKVPKLHLVPSAMLTVIAYIAYFPLLAIVVIHNRIGLFKL